MRLCQTDITQILKTSMLNLPGLVAALTQFVFQAPLKRGNEHPNDLNTSERGIFVNFGRIREEH